MCGCIFRMDSNADGPGVRFVHEHPEILDILFQGYDTFSHVSVLSSCACSLCYVCWGCVHVKGCRRVDSGQCTHPSHEVPHDQEN